MLGAAAAVLLNPAVRQPHCHAIEQWSQRRRRSRCDAEGAVILFARRGWTLSLAAAATGTGSPTSHDFFWHCWTVALAATRAGRPLEPAQAATECRARFGSASTCTTLASSKFGSARVSPRASLGVCEDTQQSLSTLGPRTQKTRPRRPLQRPCTTVRPPAVSWDAARGRKDARLKKQNK